jgi:aminoglycoside phosphotransferase (APT) family kinase protein
LQITQALGLATQRPYYFDQSGEIFSTPAFVIEYIEGKPEFSPPNLADFSRQLATHLARIHSVDGSNPALAFLSQSVKSFETTFKPPSTLNESLEEGRIRGTLEAVWPLPRRNAPVLLHGDYWPGNILWREEKLVAVIDWEDARIGEPLSDLAISRLDLLWIYGLEAMEIFTHHYQSLAPLDYTDLPYWDLAAALRLVRLAGADLAGLAAFYPPFGRPDITEQTIREYYSFFISQAFEKLG